MYSKERPLRVFTAFSGYDSQCLALERLKAKREGFDYELVGWSEIEPSAIKAHNLLFPMWADRNFGDISKIDWSKVADFDFFTYSSPCTDFSTAGLQRGGAEGSGTRSSLLWECRRAIVAKRPAYCMLENVKALVSRKFLPLFQKWRDDSFDHEFCTWDDPAKGYYPNGVKVEKIRSIKVYDEDDNEIPFEYDRERVEEIKLTLN